MSREREGERPRERVKNNNKNFKSSSAKNGSTPRSTIFVNNLPDKLDIFGFKGIFNKIGSVDDAIIPVVQRGRRRFGFIRFKNHESVNMSIQKFNNKFIRESKISVFEANRDMVSKRTNVSGKGGEGDFKKPDLDAFERRGKKQEQRYQVFGHKNYSFGNKFDIFNNEDVSQKSCIKGQVNKERLKALLCSLVGETDLPVRVEFIWNKLKSEKVGVVKVTAIQKNKFILEFGSEDEADLALTGSQTLADLFSKLKKWAWTDYPEKRFVWLETVGIPPQGWLLENFRDIALKWGRLIGFDRNFEEADSMESLKMLILTNKMRSIVDDVILELENTSFRIWVEEVEEPELNQFYKAEDFDPKLNDSSEEEEEEEGEFRKKEEGRVHKEDIRSKPLSVVHEEDGDESKELVGEKNQANDGAIETHPNEEKSRVDLESEKDVDSNYESDDDFDLSLNSIPSYFDPSVVQDSAISKGEESGNMEVHQSYSQGAQSQPREDDSNEISLQAKMDPFCFGEDHVTQNRSISKGRKRKYKKKIKVGAKRKGLSPRGRGSSSKRRLAKRRKGSEEKDPEAVEEESPGRAKVDAENLIPKLIPIESPTSSGVVARANVLTSDLPDNSEEKLRARAIRQMNFSNRLGIKILKGEKNEEAYIQRAMRQIKERKRYVEQCLSEENSLGSAEF